MLYLVMVRVVARNATVGGCGWLVLLCVVCTEVWYAQVGCSGVCCSELTWDETAVVVDEDEKKKEEGIVVYT
jgi:hypothetical protein